MFTTIAALIAILGAFLALVLALCNNASQLDERDFEDLELELHKKYLNKMNRRKK